MDAKRYLFHTYEILDVEYDMLRMIAQELRVNEKTFAADDIDNARNDLSKAILAVKKSWNSLKDDLPYEQIKMDI